MRLRFICEHTCSQKQIGLDERLWANGIRPYTAAYAEMAFQRTSVDKACEFSQHKGESLKLTSNRLLSSSEAAPLNWYNRTLFYLYECKNEVSSQMATTFNGGRMSLTFDGFGAAITFCSVYAYNRLKQWLIMSQIIAMVDLRMYLLKSFVHSEIIS